MDQGPTRRRDVLWPSWAESVKMNRDLLVELEARAHPHGSDKNVNTITAVRYNDDEVKAQQQEGERPAG